MKQNTQKTIPIKLLNQVLKVRWETKSLSIYGLMLTKKNSTKAPNIQALEIGNKKYPLNPVFSVTFHKLFRIIIYKVLISYQDLNLTHINTTIYAIGKNKTNQGSKRALSYNLLGHHDYLMLRSKIHKISNSSSTFIKQGGGNTLLLVQRDPNVTDSFMKRCEIALAYILAKLFSFYNPIVLFEKQSKTYEESAAIVFQRLIDQGYKKTFFILGDEKRSLYKIENPYKKNIVKKHSFKHYFLFFSAKTFLATETPFHGTELRTVSRFIHWHIRYSKRFKYVFLQHGIMLMVSLNSKTRSAFRKGGWLSKHGKIVVASEAEADHFIELGGYKKEDLFITGIPKFDLCVKNKHADQIVIMPTWKPWEEALAKSNPQETSYYNMLQEILHSVPTKLKSKIKILPHPLISKYLKETNLKQYIPEKFSYHQELKNTALLITDYSSIAYDAFYRGTPVIFWWKYLEQNMEIYKAHLMLNNNNVFGDVCMNTEELKKSVIENYKTSQKSIYIKRFKKLVEFSDGKNTDRLIEKLKNENYI